ncbi:Nonribosomal peptide synthase atnA [Colletotrichum sp. SAR 10_76]|nr:Nonribosomal peptide synthase atnA [Colletotrichum sp. SAR 10_75]KAI8205152.1 Nonribosomal peptide synthase atnA [Colletotrichum sp. SAR 10_76]
MIASHGHGSPLNIAVDAWDGTLSYAELDEKSSNIANELVRRGVRAESKVALLFEKSVWNIVATVAVLKAGGAFVPLDPFQPDGRISNLLDKIQPKTVLSSKTYTERLRALSRNILCVEEQSTQQLFGLATAPFPSPRPWDLAYIMFTSGSTGEPKGVMVDNAACSSSIAAHGKATGFNRQTRVIQYARHTFDASIAEILTTLSFGGCIVIPSEDERLNDITSVMQLKRNGVIHFEGRKDTQLKISGQRLEASEVEYHLRSAFKTQSVVVDVVTRPTYGSKKNAKVLVAFICQQGNAESDSVDGRCVMPRQIPALRKMIPKVEAMISSVLPSWMCPSLYIPLFSLPLTANGKVDLKRLRREVDDLRPKQFYGFSELGREDEAEEAANENTELQNVMRGLWAGVLGISEGMLSASSNFLRLGGDSMAVISLVSAARKSGLALEFAQVFKNPILGDLCQLPLLQSKKTMITARPMELLDGESVALTEIAEECSIIIEDIEDAFPCTPLQEGLMAMSSTTANSFLVQYLLQLGADVDVASLKNAWNLVSKAHGILRTRLVDTSTFGIQQVVVHEALRWNESSNLDEYLNFDLKKASTFGVPLNRFGIIYDTNGLASSMVWTTATIDMIPFEQMGIQNISRIDANCKAACEFQSMMIIQPEVDMAMDGAPFTAFERPQDLDKFNSHAVMVECSLQETSVHVNFNYDTEYLDHSQASRLVDYFDTALGFLVASQTTRLETFFAQPSAEDIKQIQAWNQKRPCTTEACIHQLFETQAQIQPNAQAIFSWDGHLSFSELDKKASQLARVLVDLGVGPESKVVYCFEKSLYTVVSMLAILKAGGAMVPLDPAYPLERKSFIVQNVAAKVVVVSSSQADSFSGLDTPVVTVNQALFENMDKLHVQAFSSAEVQPHHAATVLFTSGTNAQSAGMQMFKGSRILQFSAHVFDVSVIEIVNALVLGACICIPSDEDRLNNLAGFVTESQADWAFFTPSFARTLDPGDLPSLKTVCMGGEAMTVDNIETWASRVQLINAYGPCEGSVCTVTRMSNMKFLVGDSIGHGLNCHVWIVDPDTHERLLPIGSIGEILIDGPSVARGYLGDPEKTSKSFIADPSWTSNFNFGEESRRMYKTGDLGGFNSDGSVSYLGRKDTQIKLRGQRIELGEIEHRLIDILPAGSLVAVDVLSLSRSSSKHLVAFIQLGGLFDNFSERKNAVDDMASQLKTQLLSVLPIYMVPAHFQCLESLPFGTTGKLDRRRLKEYAANLDTLHGLGTAPNEGDFRDFEFGGSLLPDEDIALSISNKLAELLSRNDPERKQFLRGSNFNPFYAGMDSVQVVSLSTFVRKTYGTSLPIKKYMNSAATIRDLARWIAEDRQVTKQDDGLELLDEIEKYDKSLPALRPQDTAWNEKFSPKAVFLTGATGFLGNQLLCQLLERPGVSKVVTLVREELKSYPAYSQTKFVSEILVARFAQRLARAGHGSLVSIVKPGLIMGSSSDGISNTDDFLWRVTASALDIGLRVDEEPGSWIAAAGVDLVAKIILDSCLLQPADCGASVSKKILSGVSLGDYWKIVTEETGRVTEPSDAKNWLGALQCEVEGKGPGHRMWPVMHFVEDKGGILGQPLGAMTAEDQAEHQAVVRKALRKSLQYLVAIGYMSISRTSSENGDNAND